MEVDKKRAELKKKAERAKWTAEQRARKDKEEAGKTQAQRWHDSPAAYVLDRFGIVLTPEQEELLQYLAFGAKKKVAVKAGGKVGKSLSAALATFWFAECLGYNRVNLFSATGENLEKVLWAEIRNVWQLSQKAAYPIECPFPPVDPQTGFNYCGCAIVGWVAAKVESIGGISGAKQLFVVDEASGDKFDILFAGILHNTMSGQARMLVLGNPTRPVGVFHAIFRDLVEYDSWEKRTMAAGIRLEDGSIVAKYDQPDTGLSNKETIDEIVRDYGPKSDFVRVRILGEFAESSENSVVSMAWIEEAHARFGFVSMPDPSNPKRRVLDREKAAKHLAEPLQLGVDVAWKGDDNSVVFPRRGLLIMEPFIIHGRDPTEVANFVLEVVDRLAYKNECVKIKVDTIGVGGGTWSALAAAAKIRKAQKAEAQHHGKACPCAQIEPISVNVGERPTMVPSDNSPGYKSLRDQIWFAGAYFLRDGGIMEQNPKLEEELLSPTFKYVESLKIHVESKDDVKKRLKRSPDLADAFCLCVYEGSTPVSYSKIMGAGKGAVRGGNFFRGDKPVGYPGERGNGNYSRRPVGW